MSVFDFSEYITSSTTSFLNPSARCCAGRGSCPWIMLMAGGGRIFGPRPRFYGFKLNKKVKQLARKSALSYKAKENKIIVLEDFSMEVPKTSQMAGMSANLNLSRKNSLIVLSEQNKNIYLSSRNLQGVEVVIISDLNTYNIMKASTLVLTESAVDVLQSTI